MTSRENLSHGQLHAEIIRSLLEIHEAVSSGHTAKQPVISSTVYGDECNKTVYYTI
jgi:hypothetical protein